MKTANDQKSTTDICLAGKQLADTDQLNKTTHDQQALRTFVFIKIIYNAHVDYAVLDNVSLAAFIMAIDETGGFNDPYECPLLTEPPEDDSDYAQKWRAENLTDEQVIKMTDLIGSDTGIYWDDVVNAFGSFGYAENDDDQIFQTCYPKYSLEKGVHSQPNEI